MITREQYLKIHELHDLKLSIRKTSKALGLTERVVENCRKLSYEEYVLSTKRDHHHLDNYRQYILEWLKICPQIKSTNIYLKLTNEFPDIKVSRSAYYRYMNDLREKNGYKQKRITHLRENSPPGLESQTDFGQYKLIDMYGNSVRVYFFCMVLSYSRMKYVFFSVDPFTTQSAIKAHENAFRYFGGRTQNIVYDQDRVYVISENLGNIIFVPKFEKYVRQTGFGVIICRPYDPQSKGYVKLYITREK